ncbi:MAG: hypothetical protein O7H41_04505 [Planctomycetota bacterium]|nr:hypothetical protein [Planctomycetota bacterium]
MQSAVCFAIVSLLISLPALDGEKSVCKLDGKPIVFSGEPILGLPKGISGTIEAKEIKATLIGEEVVTINGTEFRAYGEKVEVDGRAFPVASGETLRITEKGIFVLPARGARRRGSMYVLNGKSILIHGYQTVTFPEGFDWKIRASGMKATLVGDHEVRLNKTRIRIRGDEVEINGRNYGVARGFGYEDLEIGFRILAEDDLLPSDEGGVVCTLNGKEIVISGRRTLTIPEGMHGTIEAEKMMVTLNGEEEVIVNGRILRAYGTKVEVNGKVFSVNDDVEILEIMPNGIIVHNRLDIDPHKSIYRLNGKRIALAGKQKLEIPEGVRGKIDATVITATLAGTGEMLVDQTRFRTDGDYVLMNGKKIPVQDSERLEFSDEGFQIISLERESKNRGKKK